MSSLPPPPPVDLLGHLVDTVDDAVERPSGSWCTLGYVTPHTRRTTARRRRRRRAGPARSRRRVATDHRTVNHHRSTRRESCSALQGDRRLAGEALHCSDVHARGHVSDPSHGRPAAAGGVPPLCVVSDGRAAPSVEAMTDLTGKTIAFLVANEGIEQVELTEPWEAVEDAGGQPVLVAPEAGEVQAFNHLDKADTFPVDRTVADADLADYDGLVLPGGVANPDRCAPTTMPSPSSGVRRRRQAGRRHLPRPVDAGRGRRRPRPHRSRRGRACRPTCATPAPTWVDEEVVVDRATSSPAASPTTSPRSTRRSCPRSPAETASGTVRTVGVEEEFLLLDPESGPRRPSRRRGRAQD